MLHSLPGFFCQRVTTLLTKRKVIQGMASGAHDASARRTAFRTIWVVLIETRTAEGTNIRTDIVVTKFTEICIRVQLTTTVRTCPLVQQFTTGCTIFCLWFVDCSTLRTANTARHVCTSLHLHGLTLFTYLFLGSHFALDPGRSLCYFISHKYFVNFSQK